MGGYRTKQPVIMERVPVVQHRNFDKTARVPGEAKNRTGKPSNLESRFESCSRILDPISTGAIHPATGVSIFLGASASTLLLAQGARVKIVPSPTELVSRVTNSMDAIDRPSLTKQHLMVRNYIVNGPSPKSRRYNSHL